jgi:hypothetical protein
MFVAAFGAIVSGGAVSIEIHQSGDDGVADPYSALAGSKVTVADDQDGKLAYVEIVQPTRRSIPSSRFSRGRRCSRPSMTRHPSQPGRRTRARPREPRSIQSRRASPSADQLAARMPRDFASPLSEPPRGVQCPVMALYRFSPTAFIRTADPLRINALR